MKYPKSIKEDLLNREPKEWFLIMEVILSDSFRHRRNGLYSYYEDVLKRLGLKNEGQD